MRRVIFAAVLVCVMSAGAFAASEDMSVYVRQDVFDAKMETLFLRLHGEIENLGTRLEGKIDALSEKIDGVDKKLSEKIDGVDRKLSARIDGVDKRIDDTHTYIYWILVLLGAILIMPFVNKFWEFRKEQRTPAVTLEEVQRLIEKAISENNMRVRA